MFANDIGIDLGTATTLIYIAGKGIVLREPSIVAMDERNGQVLAVGDEAYTMLGKTASDIRVVRPLEDGVISDYEVTEQMLKHFFAKVNPSRVFKPRVCVCVPSAITEVESRSVIDTVMSSGARNVYLIEEPVAAAIGAGMDITRPGGIVVLDIGGGTSDIAVLSLNGIVCKSSVKMAGNKMNAAIVRYVRSTYNVLIGDSTADRVKREIGTVWTEGQPEKTVEVKGRNLVTGLPQKITLSSYELEMPLRVEVERIISALQSVMEQTPPELVADIEKNGLLMTGGGAMLDGLDKLITNRVRIRAHLAENPVEAVAIGTGKSLDSLGKTEEELLKEVQPQAEEITRMQVLLLAIAKKEGLDVNEQEVNAQLYQLCMRSGEDFKQVREAYEKSGMIFTLRDRILADKAMDAIYAKAQVKEVEPKAAEKTEENN